MTISRALPRATSPIWVGMGGLVAAGATYLALLVAGRGLGAGGYDGFSYFWSVTVIASLGAFLPLEQVLSRRFASGQPVGPLLRSASVYAGVVTAAATVLVVGLAVGGAMPSTRDLGAVLPSYVLMFVGNGLQVMARGIAAGGKQFRVYAVIITTDAVTRAVALGGLAIDDVHRPWVYALAVALSAVAAGLFGTAALWLRDRPQPGGAVPRVSTEAAGLAVAMLSMQTVLNSPVLIASALHDPHVRAGEILALSSLARLPVFVAQVAQAAYLSHIATAVHHDERAKVRVLVHAVLAAVATIAVTTTTLAGTIGPWLLRSLFGSTFSPSSAVCVLVAAGVSLYLCASVTNDVTVALGRHARSGPVWALTLAIGAATAALAPTTLLRATLPLLLSSAAAIAGLGLGAARRRTRPDPTSSVAAPAASPTD